MSTAVSVPRRVWLTRSRRRAIVGYLWIMPWLVGLVAFKLGPTLAAFALSFTRYDIITTPIWIGLENYVYAATTDPLFWRSLRTTLYYVGVSVPLGIVASLGLSLLLNMGKRGTATYRTFFFLPNLTPVVAGAILWLWIYHPQFGPLNYLLRLMGIPPIGWLGSVEWAVPSLILVAFWYGIGGSRMVIFLAGLQAVPNELYEAAEVDGAGRWARFRYIILPMISPTMFFNLVLAIIVSLRVFEVAFLTTVGSPNYATWFYMLHLYQAAFRDFDMGYASALAWILFMITLALTYVQIKLSKRWVYYEGEERES
ncbi:MAG: sugar ABC transporter permease [Chloroflexi bacterium]|nr:sugar ABC transporter permease [Chloroflexota bacterium]